MAGTVVGGYRIESQVGQGSMGTVYSALEVALERRVALKVLTPELARDARFRERFLRESRLAASLEHPHIIPIHSAGEVDGHLYLTMRYVDGRDLAAVLKSLGRLDPERALEIAGQVGSALDTAHRRGLIHRDVKPANILLARHDDKRDHAYLCDFGLAKHASTVSSLTGDRGIVGTVDYLAPEQVEGYPVDGRADVYALGCVLYQCLTGEPPFRRANELAALLAHINDKPPRPSERQPELPKALDAVIAAALAKDRDLRYDSCAALVDAARSALRGEEPAAPAARPAPAVRTFLFADVRGYTSYTRERGDEAAAELASRFAAIVTGLAPSYNGSMLELRGDEALVVFDSARAALRFAVALQDRVTSEQLPRTVGVGIDTGEAVPVEDGYRGGALNRAARLCALARPGEVLASDAVRELAGATEGISYGFRRVERLKGFERPVGVVEIHPAERRQTRELRRRAARVLVGTTPKRRMGLGAAVAAVGVGVLALIWSMGGGADVPALSPNSVALIELGSGRVGESVPTGAGPGAAAFGSGALWITNQIDGTVSRVEASTGKVLRTIPVPGTPTSIAAGAGAVWVVNTDLGSSEQSVAKIAPSFDRVVATFRLPKTLAIGSGAAIASGPAGLWAVTPAGRALRIDPLKSRVAGSVDVGNDPTAIAVGSNSVWVANTDDGTVSKIEPPDTVTATIPVGRAPSALAIGAGGVWVVSNGEDTVRRLDPKTGSVVASIKVGKSPVAVAAGSRDVWVANAGDGSVSLIDPNSNRVTKTIRTGAAPAGIAVTRNHAWVTLREQAATAGAIAPRVARILVDPNGIDSVDPALAYTLVTFQIEYATSAKLLNYPDAPAPRGAQLRPEVAMAMPTISSDGRTYTFTIRDGYRFSPPSNARVTAQTFKDSIERMLNPRMKSLGSMFYQDIVGVREYQSGRAKHISGISVRGNQLSIRLTRPSGSFPARVAMPFFSAVPSGTPVDFKGVPNIPSAGPYYIASYTPGQRLTLKRNPNYGGQRPRRLDALEFEITQADPTALVKAGKADYALHDTRPHPELAAAFGPGSAAARSGKQRYFTRYMGAVQYYALNTSRPLFSDVRLRRAVSHAIDRTALARLDVNNLKPADGYLPPNLPGYVERRLYPLRANKEAARRLAGRRDERAILYTCNEPFCLQEAEVIKRNLRPLGINVVVKPLAWGPLFETVGSKGAAFDVTLAGWVADYADPSTFLIPLFSRTGIKSTQSSNTAYFDDARITRELERADTLTGAERYRAFAQLEAKLRRLSPYIAIGHARRSGFFSARIGCQIDQPVYGFDLAALCVP